MKQDNKPKPQCEDRTPGVVLVNVDHSVPLLKGIADQAERFGWGLMDLEFTRRVLLPGMHPIGLLSSENWDSALNQKVLSKGIPVVRVGHYPTMNGDLVVPVVIPDMARAARLAAEHFAERGFKHLAYVGNDPGQYPWYNAFLDRATELGCKAHLLQVKQAPDDVLDHEQRINVKVKQISNWLAEMPKPLGVFTYNDRNAVTIFATAKTMGLRIPEEVSLLGLGNDPTTCPFFPVPLSSIDMDKEHWGRQAVRLLKRLVDGEPAPREPLMVPPKGVVERQSTNLMAVSDPVVGRALRFIWDHFREQLSLDEVAAAAGVARSTICRKFKMCLKRGVNAEIRRKRLEYCTRLLCTTKMTIEEVASASGFASKAYLFRAFRKAFGMTPRAYREQS